jgi:hypothetical protein
LNWWIEGFKKFLKPCFGNEELRLVVLLVGDPPSRFDARPKDVFIWRDALELEYLARLLLSLLECLGVQADDFLGLEIELVIQSDFHTCF